MQSISVNIEQALIACIHVSFSDFHKRKNE